MASHKYSPCPIMLGCCEGTSSDLKLITFPSLTPIDRWIGEFLLVDCFSVNDDDDEVDDDDVFPTFFDISVQSETSVSGSGLALLFMEARRVSNPSDPLKDVFDSSDTLCSSSSCWTSLTSGKKCWSDVKSQSCHCCYFLESKRADVSNLQIGWLQPITCRTLRRSHKGL